MMWYVVMILSGSNVFCLSRFRQAHVRHVRAALTLSSTYYALYCHSDE
jgi:hypothetical protein